jgi:hypothetical protein
VLVIESRMEKSCGVNGLPEWYIKYTITNFGKLTDSEELVSWHGNLLASLTPG